LLQYVTFGDWIFFGLTALALLPLRKKTSPGPDVYRVWGFPFVPLLFALISLAVVVNVFLSMPRQSLLGTAIILSGLPLYWLTKSKWRQESCHVSGTDCLS
jgi:APA family basic amino acid/polyamine antiporter